MVLARSSSPAHRIYVRGPHHLGPVRLLGPRSLPELPAVTLPLSRAACVQQERSTCLKMNCFVTVRDRRKKRCRSPQFSCHVNSNCIKPCIEFCYWTLI